MARPIVLSNGSLHVGINNFGLVHDFYYPYVGLENHTLGKGLRHRIGVWVEGSMSWLDDGSWNTDFSYPHQALVGHIVAHNNSLGISLEFDDFVDSELSAFLRSIHVINKADRKREIRLFIHQAFVIGDSRGNTDTARFLPDSHALLHYRGDRVFIISGEEASGQRFDQYSVGLFGIEGKEGTWRDAEDGNLSMCNVEHGRVDSAIRFSLNLESSSSCRVNYWICAGKSVRQALSVQRTIRSDGVLGRMQQTAQYWQSWLKPSIDFLDRIPSKSQNMFITSAMLVKAHMDNGGAVIASTDSAMLNYGRDAYAYCWPRDGAYAVWPLIRLGYTDEVLKFFEFCKKGMHPAGYLSHKYRADGALGSSWHTFLHQDGVIAPPIQEDETALVLFIFSEYYRAHPSRQLLEAYYQDFIKPMASFLASYIDQETNLPKPSYDLWEEVFITSTYTTSVVYAALLAAADLADIMEDDKLAVSWRSIADDMKLASKKHMYSHETNFFVKGIRHRYGTIDVDSTLDTSAFYGAFMFGLFDSKEAEMQNAVSTLETRFIKDKQPALPRYENDSYRRPEGKSESNYWHITGLWLAQYYTEMDQNEAAQKIVDWLEDHSYTSNVLSEQIIPETNISTSVAPLTWSHAEYLTTMLDLYGRQDSRP